MSRYCGIDCPEGHHDIAIVDQDGTLVSKKQITDDAAGFTALTQLLTDAGDTAENPIPVAIETPRGLMVATIRATGRTVYAITRWPSPATANATPWPGRNPITPTR